MLVGRGKVGLGVGTRRGEERGNFGWDLKTNK